MDMINTELEELTTTDYADYADGQKFTESSRKPANHANRHEQLGRQKYSTFDIEIIGVA
jgi:hypothetical protein